MTKINNYIRYLLTLILLGSINVYAQNTGDLNQLLSQAGKELPTLSPSSSSPINPASFAEIIKQNINIFGHVFLDYALPFLFVFGVLTYLAWESKKEINRPLLLIFFIITIITTIYFHSILKIIALGFGFILLIVGIYKIFHGIAKSILALIFGIVILIVLLTNNIEFLLSIAFFTFLFILFIIMFIYSVEVKNKISHSNDIKKLIYSIRKPEDIKNFEKRITDIVDHFKKSVDHKKTEFKTLVSTLQNIYLQQQWKPQRIKGLINLLEKIRDNIKDFHDEYRNYIEDFNHEEADINSHYNEPIRSHLLKILEEKGKREIKNIARSEYQEYLHIYRQYLRSNRQKIINMAIKKYNKQRISRIFNEIESLLHNFWI
jgi:signal transduction histidine kinase